MLELLKKKGKMGVRTKYTEDDEKMVDEDNLSGGEEGEAEMGDMGEMGEDELRELYFGDEEGEMEMDEEGE
jgi:hypothetical protein